jgi:hypothetical protein
MLMYIVREVYNLSTAPYLRRNSLQFLFSKKFICFGHVAMLAVSLHLFETGLKAGLYFCGKRTIEGVVELRFE